MVINALHVLMEVGWIYTTDRHMNPLSEEVRILMRSY